MPVRKPAIVAALVLILATLAMLLWAATHRASAINVTVAFAGYTNTASGVRLAAFRVTNASDMTVRRWAEYDVGVKNERLPRLPRHFGQARFIAAGQSELYAVPAYTNQGNWRVMLYFSRADLRVSILDAEERVPPSVLRFVPTGLQSVPSEPAWSDWISN